MCGVRSTDVRGTKVTSRLEAWREALRHHCAGGTAEAFTKAECIAFSKGWLWPL